MHKNGLNFVALKIIEVLEEKMPGETGYIFEKCERLKEFEGRKAETLQWAYNQLDTSNLISLSQKLDLNIDDLHTFMKVMQKL